MVEIKCDTEEEAISILRLLHTGKVNVIPDTYFNTWKCMPKIELKFTISSSGNSSNGTILITKEGRRNG